MPVEFTRPIKIVGDASEDNESIWNEVGNPVVYKWQYYDGVVSQINNNAGSAQLQFTGVDISAAFNVGNDAWVGVEGYEDFFEITNVAFSGGNTLVDLDTPYNGTGTGYAYDLGNLGNFSVSVDVYNANTAVQLGVSLVGYAGRDGLIVLDISETVKAYLNPELNVDLTSEAEEYEDLNGHLRTYIFYTLTISSIPQSEEDDSANPIISVVGARQIPSAYGGNLGEYVIFNDAAGKFINKFTRPKMRRGKPFLITAAIDPDEQVYLITNGSGDVTTPQNYNGTLAIFDLNEILSDQTGKSFTIEIKRISDNGTISEILTIDLVDACEDAVMLMARNSLGGVMQWVFDGGNENSQNFGNEIKANRKVLFADNLTLNEWQCLQDFIRLGDIYTNNIVEFTDETIKTSTRIGHQVYVVDEEGSKMGVIVIPTRNRTNTKQAKHAFEIEIEYPEEFVP